MPHQLVGLQQVTILEMLRNPANFIKQVSKYVQAGRIQVAIDLSIL